MLTERDLSYIAGFFDGEGSVFLSGAACRIAISQKDPEVLLWIQSTFGGRMYHTVHNNPRLILTKNEEVVRFAEVIGPLTKRSRERLRVAAKINSTRGAERKAWREKFPPNHTPYKEAM